MKGHRKRGGMSDSGSLGRPPLPSQIGLLVAALLIGLSAASWADGPDDNQPTRVRPIPRPGIEVPAQIRQELEKKLDQLAQSIEEYRLTRPADLELLPDVEIFYRAVHDALTYNEFFDEREFAAARKLLAQGAERLAKLRADNPDWTRKTGLVVRGFVSEIDGSIQPYGLVIPAGYDFSAAKPMPLDLWFHGRGETLSELNFLTQRQTQAGTFQPANAIVLHPYGRYSNANKFAGEIDLFEALGATRKQYPIDDDRIAVRGFSMGGASTWQLAVHYPGRWVAANPGAGFSETPDFLQTFQQETLEPFWWEKKLWRWYDATDWAGNLRHCPTIAYSGELDRQKQAADMMGRALQKQGLGLVHLIGPQTQHQYEPRTAVEVERLVRKLSRLGRERVPQKIDFTTYTLRYPEMAWVQVTGLEEHWEAGRLRAELGDDEIRIQVQGITAFRARL